MTFNPKCNNNYMYSVFINTLHKIFKQHSDSMKRIISLNKTIFKVFFRKTVDMSICRTVVRCNLYIYSHYTFHNDCDWFNTQIETLVTRCIQRTCICKRNFCPSFRRRFLCSLSTDYLLYSLTFEKMIFFRRMVWFHVTIPFFWWDLNKVQSSLHAMVLFVFLCEKK